MAQCELLGSEHMAQMLGIDLEDITRFMQMTPSEQLYVGAYAVDVAKNDSWIVSGLTEDEDFIGSELIVPESLDDKLKDPAKHIRFTLAKERLEFTELAFLELATEIFANNVMVLNGIARTKSLNPRTQEVIDESRTLIEFNERRFVEIAPGKRTHEESPLTVIRSLDKFYRSSGSDFYATYNAFGMFDERDWVDSSGSSWAASIKINTHPNYFKPNGEVDSLTWRADRPLYVPRQRKPRN